MNYKFGIVTTFYNVEKYIDKCIQSVLQQDYKNWIWFVTDDFSSDNTKEILLKYCKENPQIIYLEQKHKLQMFWQPQKFVSSDCDYILVMDSDDMMLPHCIKTYNKVLNQNKDKNIVFLSCETNWISQDSDYPLHPHYLYLNSITDTENVINKGSHVWGCLRCFKNIPNLSFLENEHPINICPKIYGEDTLHNLVMHKYGNLLTIKRNLYNYRYRDFSFSKIDVCEEKAQLIKEFRETLENFKQNNILIGRSLKIWENDLFDDTNAFLMSGVNHAQNCKINLFTDLKINKNFEPLYQLYDDHDLKINCFNSDLEYVVVNCTLLSFEEIENIKSYLEKFNYKEICFYYNGNKDATKAAIFDEFMKQKVLKNPYFFSTYNSFLVFVEYKN